MHVPIDVTLFLAALGVFLYGLAKFIECYRPRR